MAAIHTVAVIGAGVMGRGIVHAAALAGYRTLQEGMAPAGDIDKAIKLGLNHPIVPFEMVDLVGLDTRR
jgi:3-hydroxyacyl-CoA dehydrogenase